MAARGARAAERAHAAGRRVMNRRISREMCGAAVALALVLGVADTFKERGQDNALVAPIAT